VHMRAFILSIPVVLVLAGCGSASTGTGRPVSASDEAARPGPPDRSPEGATEELQPLPPHPPTEPVDPTGYERSEVRGLWRLSEVEADDQTIRVTVATGGCLYFGHMTVEGVTDTSIQLVAWNHEWKAVKENSVCTADARYWQYRLRLPMTLDGRRLDGQCVPGDATLDERFCPDDFFVTRQPTPAG
jgi:hypothetical protein